MDLHYDVDLYFELSNCPKLDTFSQSDPFVVVLHKVASGPDKGKWIRIGNTEICWDNHNPRWVKCIRTNFFFEQVQLLRFDVYDADHKDLYNLTGHDFVGSCSANLGQLCHAINSKKRFDLMKDGRNVSGANRKKTTLLVRVEEVLDNQDELQMSISGHNLAALDWMGTSDPYIEFCKPLEDGTWLPVARTETIKGTLNPRWKLMKVKLARLCNGDISIPIQLRCFDWNLNGDPDLIGWAEITVQGILSGENANVTLKNSNGGRKCCGLCKRTSFGTIRIMDAIVKKCHSFLQFLRAGLEIQVVIAIDFTGSNGDPSSYTSLHALNKQGGNDYERAIRQIVEVLEPYDSDGKIPLYGFGCRMKGDRTGTSHCMSLTFDEAKAEVDGLEGVMKAYKNALQVVELSGPTLLQQIIEMASAIADMPVNRTEQTYTILLILTDGIINDMERTINSIVQAGKLPLSIIIVGVGSADFTNMDILDADDEPLKHSNGELMTRDIVQFVPFNKFKHEACILAAETLREIPDQVTDYMKMVEMSPMAEAARFSVPESQSKLERNVDTAPSNDAAYMCPLTKQIMSDPVIAADGFTYEREAIEQWFRSQNTSPQTNLELPNTHLIPNHSLRSIIMQRVQARIV